MLQDKANRVGGKGHCVCWCAVLIKEVKVFPWLWPLSVNLFLQSLFVVVQCCPIFWCLTMVQLALAQSCYLIATTCTLTGLLKKHS